MSNRIKMAFPKGEKLPENIFSDFEWLGEHRVDLYEKYGEAVLVVYQQQILGVGKSRAEALENAEANLPDAPEVITPVIKFVGNPYHVGSFRRKQD
jgi:hypothetical protein